MFADVFVCFILFVSVPGNQVGGNAKSICALKGSSLDLPCAAENDSSGWTWNVVHMDNNKEVLTEISAGEGNPKYRITKERNFTLTINSLEDADAKSYCCTEAGGLQGSCWLNRTELSVADLQVKAIPAEVGEITLTCSTSCRLNDTPLVYTWYRNREFLYEDWSPWYRELVGGDEAVKFSCGVKGYEALRSPEVSVDSVTSACFKVTYAEGTMCSHQSVNESCSITFPIEISVNTFMNKPEILACNSSCPLSDPALTYRWYWNNEFIDNCESRDMLIMVGANYYSDVISCAIKGHEDLRSDEICSHQDTCWRVNYVRRRICALEGSSVDIQSKFSFPPDTPPNDQKWIKISGRDDVAEVVAVEFQKNGKNQDTLRMKEVNQTHSAQYTFSHYPWRQTHLPGVLLVVTGLKVTMTPSTVVTEGQRVTLTCTTSCPLSNDVIYMWSVNGRPLTLERSYDKHLLLDPVDLDHAGNYSCVVMSAQNLTSAEENLTVIARGKTVLICNALKLTVLLLIVTVSVALYWNMSMKCTSRMKAKEKTPPPMDALYEDVALRPMNAAAGRRSVRINMEEDASPAMY